MLEKRWNPTVCAAALCLALLAARPSGAAVCEIDWDPDEDGVITTDINGDGSVNGLDLGVLLGQWSDECPGCVADFNGDEKVDCIDQEFLLGNWGRCESSIQEATCEDLQTLKDALPLCTVVEQWEDLRELPPHAYCDDEGNVPSFDLDTSGLVDIHDVNIINCLLNTGGPTPPYADVNMDGSLNAADRALVQAAAAVGQICPDPNQDGKIGWPDIYVLIERWKP